MRIAIDARFYGEAGPGRYVSQLLKNLEEIDKENEYTIYLKKSNFDQYHPINPKFTKKLANFHWYSFAEQLVFPLILYRGNFDLVHFTQINVPLIYLKSFVVTIHDVILHEFSTERGGLIGRIFYRMKKIPYHLIFAKDVYNSKFIIVPSETTKNDLLRYYPVNKDKIHVTLESVNHYPSSGEVSKRTEVLEKYGIGKPYLLALGSFYPHKNIEGLVKAYKIVREKGVFSGQLVLVGKESYFSAKIRNFVETQNVRDVVFPGQYHWNGYLPDEEVEPILANTFVYIQPALKEGFGIPPVEAMVFGVPAVVSRIPCLTEMCGEASLYFNPNNISDMAEKIERLATDTVLREELIKKGLENVKRFSWKKMAEETFEIYRRSGVKR